MIVIAHYHHSYHLNQQPQGNKNTVTTSNTEATVLTSFKQCKSFLSYHQLSRPSKLLSMTPSAEAIVDADIHQSYHLQPCHPLKLSSSTPPAKSIIFDAAHQSYHQRR